MQVRRITLVVFLLVVMAAGATGTVPHRTHRAEKMDPSNYITHNLLGQAYKAIGQLAEANRQFKTAVDLQHQNDPKPAGK